MILIHLFTFLCMFIDQLEISSYRSHVLHLHNYPSAPSPRPLITNSVLDDHAIQSTF